MLLQVEIQQKRFTNDALVISDLSFTAEPGEFIAIVGPSGAGKTTLLNLVAGLDQDYQGDIALGGQNNSVSNHIVAFMFQEPRLMPWLTACENIQLVLPEQTGKVDQLLQQVELENFGNHYPGQLSGGMKRRVALARAFSVSPQLLLMDEPFQSLDAPTAGRLRQLLLELWQENCPTVLFVTHDLREAVSLADRVLFLSPRPATLLEAVKVPISRPRDIDSSEVAQFCSELLQKWPQILSGSLHQDSVSAEQPEKPLRQIQGGTL